MTIGKMKKLLIILFLPLFYCCNTITKETSKVENHLTSKHLKGKVKKYSYDFFEVESYKFGEPQFKLEYAVNFIFNSFGFEESYNFISHYKNPTSIDEMFIEYSDSINGIPSKRIWKSDYSNLVSFFQYDSISKKLTKSKVVDSKNNTTTIFTFEYEKGIERVSIYDESNGLDQLKVKKFDDKGRVLEEVNYDKDGFELDEIYTFYFNDGSKKDSVVNRSTFDRKIYDITTTLIDNLDRVIKETTYDDGKLDDVEGYYTEYDDSNYNSSYNLFKFKRNSEVVLEKFRVTKKLDNMGNVSEEVILNLNNNKIVEKTVYSYKYY